MVCDFRRYIVMYVSGYEMTFCQTLNSPLVLLMMSSSTRLAAITWANVDCHPHSQRNLIIHSGVFGFRHLLPHRTRETAGGN